MLKVKPKDAAKHLYYSNFSKEEREEFDITQDDIESALRNTMADNSYLQDIEEGGQ